MNEDIKKVANPPVKIGLDSPGADEAGAAMFDYLLECIEDWTSTNSISWYTIFGVISLLQTYMKDLMLGRIGGEE